MSVRLKFVFSFSLLFFIFEHSSIAREALIYDFATDRIEEIDKTFLIDDLKNFFLSETRMNFVEEEKVRAALSVQNPLQEQTNLLILSQQRRYGELKAQLDEAKEKYRASEFEGAREALRQIWTGLETVSLVVEARFVVEILSYLAATHFYLRDQPAAESHYAAIWDLGLASLFSRKSFPPNLTELFDLQEARERWRRTPFSFSSNSSRFEVVHLGTKLPLTQVDDRFQIRLPLGHPILMRQPLHLRADGVSPVIFLMEDWPARVSFESLADRALDSNRLFVPLTRSEPPKDLLEFLKKSSVDLILLGEIKKDLGDQILGRFQWLDAKTQQTSQIVEVSASSFQNFAGLLKPRLLSWLNSDGLIISREEFKQRPVAMAGESSSPSLYSKWWFWSLVGLGAAAVGTGTYFLLQGDDGVKFVVQPAN